MFTHLERRTTWKAKLGVQFSLNQGLLDRITAIFQEGGVSQFLYRFNQNWARFIYQTADSEHQN